MTLTVEAAPVRVRLLPVRPCDPPFDDELPEAAAPLPPSIGVQGALALQLTPHPHRPPVTMLRVVEEPTPDDCDDHAPRVTPTAELPAVAPWAHRLVIGIVEALTGVRPVVQLERLTSDRVYRDLCRAAGARTATAKLGGPRAAQTVRSIRVSEPTDGVAEVSAVVRAGARCRAVALRVEGLDGRWRCTALQVG